MTRLALMIDMDACIGCKSCEAACKQEHGLGPDEYRNQVLWLENETQPDLAFLTVTCQHCERPACLRACPVSPKAITKDPVTGVVSVDESRCTGCGECVKACPYGAMGFDAVDHHAVKCDLCADRRSQGEAPACVSVCPAKAIHFGERDSLLEHAEQIEGNILDTNQFLMGPATIYLKPGTKYPADEGDNHKGTQFPSPDVHVPLVMGPNGHPGQNLTPSAPYLMTRDERAPDRIVPGGCNICFNGCPVKFHIKGNTVVGITGNDDDPIFQGRICPKSQMTLQMYNSPHRLTSPLKRVGKRGEDKFVEISWDQALDEIAEKLTTVRDEYGPEALAIFMGTRAGLITKYGYVKRFSTLWGTPNMDGTDSFCSAGKTLALETIQGTPRLANIYTPDDIGSAGFYLYIGDNQAETRPVFFGMVNAWRKKTGARMVTVDPRLSATAAKSDEWLGIRSGTDMALGLALIYTIFEQQLEDKRFCTDWIIGLQDWRDFIMGKGYTADWAAPITDLSAARIRRLAQEIAAADGCMIYCSRGLNQHSNSVQTNRVFMFLAAITGNIGRKGGGYFNMTSELALNCSIPSGRNVPVTRSAVGRGPMTWMKAITEGNPYPIRAMIAGNNPFSSWPAQDKVRASVDALDLIVHIELFKNETSHMADYVLPAASGIEKGGITRSSEDRRTIWNDKLIDPPGQAKADSWIWTELGKRFGFDDIMTEEYKDTAVFWDSICNQTEDMRGCTTERMRSRPNRTLRSPLPEIGAPELGTFELGRPEDQTVGAKYLVDTKSGKLEFWTKEIEATFSQFGLSALPEFYSEREQLIDMAFLSCTEETAHASPFYKNTLASKFEIMQPDANSDGQTLRSLGFDTELLTGRPPAPHFHSWTHYFWQSQEMWPDLYVQIHPKKAHGLGIQDGETVKVESSEGVITARAWIRTGIRETAVFIPIGWGEKQPYNPWKSNNFLTSLDQRDPFADQINLKTKLCRVSRIKH
jgi:anaerobic selenocysteine-containing dehydrogenase/Fe-S-cluster-containing dehydrogenase component